MPDRRLVKRESARLEGAQLPPEHRLMGRSSTIEHGHEWKVEKVSFVRYVLGLDWIPVTWHSPMIQGSLNQLYQLPHADAPTLER